MEDPEPLYARRNHVLVRAIANLCEKAVKLALPYNATGSEEDRPPVFTIGRYTRSKYTQSLPASIHELYERCHSMRQHITQK
jgi:hypothetical protein